VRHTKPDGKGRGRQGREGVRQWMLADLAKSDLDQHDAEKMQLKPCTAAEGAALNLAPREHGAEAGPGYIIPYFGPDGKLIKGMFRYRHQITEIEHGLLKGTKLRKYSQPKGTEPRIYFPPVGNFDWEHVVADHQSDVTVTEGEKKAASSCKLLARPTMGEGGAWSWKNKKRGQRLIPDLEQFVWKDRNVTIAYDSDASSNKQVALAEAQFARILADRGAKVRAPRLPSLGCNKTGLDDFLCRPHGPEEFDQLLERTGLFHEIEELYKMNTEMMLVKNPCVGLILPNERHPADQPKYRMQSLSVLLHEVFADRTIYVTNAEGKTKPLPASKEWLRWPGRNTADSICYEPGQPERIGSQFNAWPGWATTPKKGNVKPFLKLYNAMVETMEELWRMWPMQWLAYPIQHPGVKLRTAMIFWGATQGSGKSLLGETIARVYGNTAVTIGYNDLKNPHNAWAQFKQFVAGEEITSNESRELADTVKNLITNPTLQLNQKYVPIFTIRNTINLYLTSNHANAVYMDDEDRRYFVHEVLTHDLMKPEAKFFDKNGEYDKWLSDPASTPALHDYLLNVDLTGFDPYRKAPRTAARQSMIEKVLSATSAGRLALELREAASPEVYFGEEYTGCDIWKLATIIELKNPNEDQRLNTYTLGEALSKLSIRDTEAVPITNQPKPRARLRVIFNRDKYENCSDSELGKLYAQQWEGKPLTQAERVTARMRAKSSEARQKTRQ
jgi:hypothetical protein